MSAMAAMFQKFRMNCLIHDIFSPTSFSYFIKKLKSSLSLTVSLFLCNSISTPGFFVKIAFFSVVLTPFLMSLVSDLKFLPIFCLINISLSLMEIKHYKSVIIRIRISNCNYLLSAYSQLDSIMILNLLQSGYIYRFDLMYKIHFYHFLFAIYMTSGCES